MIANTVENILQARNNPEIAAALEKRKNEIAAIEEYDFVDDLVPLAWCEKNPRYSIPSNSIWFPEYFDWHGKKMFSNWTGNELYARFSEDITAKA